MAAAIVSSPRTPQRVYSLTNICCLCGFSFVVKEIDKEGNVQFKKLFRLKLKMTDEKRNVIQQVIPISSSAEGVCVKCFGKIEKIIKYRREIDGIISHFEESMRRYKLKTTPRSTARKKRLLRSPEVSAPELKNTCRADITNTHHNVTQPIHTGHKYTDIKPARKSLKFVDDVRTVQNSKEEMQQDSSVCSVTQHQRKLGDCLVVVGVNKKDIILKKVRSCAFEQIFIPEDIPPSKLIHSKELVKPLLDGTVEVEALSDDVIIFMYFDVIYN
ncbi:uncharacterized protein LOC134267563 [Saccostrea cucullata]|uniref:uncharacterized protein LOC134267563 n=1 Tax=Saccostrea cuccullata TaxID=36930 RepID=UPI002ED32C80